MIQCLANANYLLKTLPRCFREKFKQFLLEDINMQLGHKIKGLTTKRNHLLQQLMGSTGRVVLLASRWSVINHDSCKALIPHSLSK